MRTIPSIHKNKERQEGDEEDGEVEPSEALEHEEPMCLSQRPPECNEEDGAIEPPKADREDGEVEPSKAEEREETGCLSRRPPECNKRKEAQDHQRQTERMER